MKILQVTHHFLPRHGAGVETYTDRIARALLQRGHEVSVVTTDDDPLRTPASVRQREERGLPVIEIAHPRVVRAPEDTFGMPAVLDAFDAVLDRLRPDVVHFQHLMYVGLEAPVRVAARGIPSALTLHEFWLLCARGGQFLRADGTRCDRAEDQVCGHCLGSFRFGRTPLEGRVARASERVHRATGFDPFVALKRWRTRWAAEPEDSAAWTGAPPAPMLAFLERRRTAVAAGLAPVAALLAPSQFLLKKFRDAGFPARRLIHSPYGLDLERFREVEGRRAPPEPGVPLRVGFVGSIVPQKGADVLLRAQRLLPRGGMRVAIHGNTRFQPDYGAELRRLAVPEETVFCGSFGASEAARVMAGLDLLVVPSVWYENAPIVISEAFAAGVPVVASRLGGMAEMVTDGVDGMHFEPGDPQDLARVLDHLIQDRAAWALLSAGVRAPRSIDDDAQGLEELYAKLCGAG